MTEEETPQAGHNNPPSPIDLFNEEYEGLFLEIKNWADGDKITTDEGCKAVEKLVGLTKDASKAATVAKEEHFRPHKLAADKVSADWKPVLKGIEMKKISLLGLINPYKQEKLRAQQEEERITLLAAEELERVAREEAIKARESGDLEKVEAAAVLVDDVNDAHKLAKQVARQPAAKNMRIKREGTLDDPRKALQWMIDNHPEVVINMLNTFIASRAHSNGGPMDGVTFTETKVAF